MAPLCRRRQAATGRGGGTFSLRPLLCIFVVGSAITSTVLRTGADCTHPTASDGKGGDGIGSCHDGRAKLLLAGKSQRSLLLQQTLEGAAAAAGVRADPTTPAAHSQCADQPVIYDEGFSATQVISDS